MTEQEVMKKVDECERQIVRSYNDLLSAARKVGSKGYQSASHARSSAIQEAWNNTLKRTLLPLLISLIGLFWCSVSFFWGIVLIITGIAISYNLRNKAVTEQHQVESEGDYAITVADSQQRNLNSVLDNNTRI